MKNLIIITLLSFAPMFVFAQLEVVGANSDVGIGTSTPTEKLEVNGIAKTKGNTVETTGASATTLYERTDGAAVLIGAGFTGAGFTFDENYNFDIRTRGRSFIQNRLLSQGALLLRGKSSNQSIGIGVANPTEKLHVAGNIAYQGGVIISDRRLKRNATDFKYGLKEVMKLRPLTYDYTGEGGTVSGKYNVGLFAQDFQKIAPEFVSKFTYTEEDEEGKVVSEKEYLKIYDTGIKYMLVNAVQEQQDIIETQKDEIATLREEVSEMKAMMQTILNGQNTNTNQQNIELNGSGTYLEQNQPNPFNNHTLIKYSVPTDATNALVNIFNENGQLIHSELITQTGVGQIQVKAGTIPTGTYSYSLVVNGKITDTKRMVIVK